MDFFLYVVTFIISWSISLFAVLPIGVERSTAPGPFEAAGAPVRPDIMRKFVIAAVIAGIVTGLFALIVHRHWISFR